LKLFLTAAGRRDPDGLLTHPFTLQAAVPAANEKALVPHNLSLYARGICPITHQGDPFRFFLLRFGAWRCTQS
jgi:hypothetical protein